ncbi:MAG: GNAT family N-acetyltransferase [Bacteroidetes bacterium]|nr:GNAT family N-acetyltransferase [Bacteroidota bacterium]
METNNFSIRYATKDDCQLILRFIEGIAAYEKLSDQVEASEEKIAEYLFGEKAIAECLLGFEGNTPVGFALFFHNYSTFVSRPGIYLEDLFIEPEFRAKGYGKKLLLELVKIAKERNCGRLEWSVLNWNKPAIDFYESLGAVAMKGWTVYRLDEKAIENLHTSYFKSKT